MSAEITEEFIKENVESCKNKTHKKGGPYNKQDRQARRNEVFRLHFEYGYSAVRISDILKINRNTINGDIQYWYSQVAKKWKSINPTNWIARYIERLELQKTRLREAIDSSKNAQEKISHERLILDVESRILQTQLKLLDSFRLNHDMATRWLNNWMKKNNHKDRFLTSYDVLGVSEKSQARINRILNDEKRNGI
ncbi:MAG TPA: hypothetical protein VLD38_03360 [Nitrosopumilaceae archaeon]|nr:hypothetical protein [Nitrosopumilaceae archaeon]